MFITCGSTDIRGQKGCSAVLTIFRRHLKSCPHTSRSYRRCRCPIHVEGSLAGESVRRSLDHTSWEAAENEIREWTHSGKIGGRTRAPKPIPEAIDDFLEDARARNLRDSTVHLLESVLKRSLLRWCEEKGYCYLSELDLEKLRKYRASWSDAPVTAQKKLERIRSFFRFCHQSEWISKNPALEIRSPKVELKPTLPFSRKEYEAIVAACDELAHNGKHAWDTPRRARAFVHVLRYSGLRIGDAARLHRTRLSADGRLFLYTQKTGVPVFVPLPPFVSEELRALAPQSEYFFWTGNGKLKSALSSWDRTLRIVFDKAKVENGHAHRFRDTFAVELLLAGTPLEDVAILLGHSSKDVTEKHYAPWIKARQDRLEEQVKRTWENPPQLRLVSA